MSEGDTVPPSASEGTSVPASSSDASQSRVSNMISPPIDRRSPNVSNDAASNEEETAGNNNNGEETANNNNVLDVDDFPSIYTCPISGDPPTHGVTFNIPGGQASNQVFEYRELFRYIATHGYIEAFRGVSHPLTRAYIRRDQALSCVRPIPPDTQTLINNERRRQNLPTDVLELTDEDRSHMQMMLRRVRDP